MDPKEIFENLSESDKQKLKESVNEWLSRKPRSDQPSLYDQLQGEKLQIAKMVGDSKAKNEKIVRCASIIGAIASVVAAITGIIALLK